MDDPALINPRRLRGEPELPRTAVLGLIREDLELLREAAGETEKAGVRDFFKVHLAPEGRFCLAGPALGAPQAVMVAEKLFALGVENLLFLGLAGSLGPGLRTGDLLLLRGALSEEGVSAHYPLESEARPDPGLNRALEARARRSGVGLKAGRIWTTDAPYRETWSKVEKYGGQGIAAVDMESSALLAVAAFRGRAATGLMSISDELFSGTWKPGFKEEALHKARKTAAGLMIRTAGEIG